MESKISIIIPAYNIEGYIEKCLDGILNQSFKEYEVIIIDDGSTDNTPQICDKYALRDNRIQVIHKKNEGVSIARNSGIKSASGKYMLFHDGDDFIEPFALQQLYNLAEEKKADTIIYGYYRYENGKVKETCYPIFNEGYYQESEIMEELLPRFIGISNENINNWIKGKENALYVENPALWRALVSSRIIKENNLNFNKDLKVGEDTCFITEYLSCTKKCYVHQKCYYYLVSRENSTISLYENNPVAKLDGKNKLLDARLEITKKISKNRNIDIEKNWTGTVIMSCLELSFLLSMKNNQSGFLKRYNLFLSYVRNAEVHRILKHFNLKLVMSFKVVPFIFLKYRLYFILFLSSYILNAINYKFERN